METENENFARAARRKKATSQQFENPWNLWYFSFRFDFVPGNDENSRDFRESFDRWLSGVQQVTSQSYFVTKSVDKTI